MKRVLMHVCFFFHMRAESHGGPSAVAPAPGVVCVGKPVLGGVERCLVMACGHRPVCSWMARLGVGRRALARVLPLSHVVLLVAITPLLLVVVVDWLVGGMSAGVGWCSGGGCCVPPVCSGPTCRRLVLTSP